MGIIDSLRRLLANKANEPQDSATATIEPGKVFPWHKAVTITALDPLMISLPSAILDDDVPIGSVVQGSEDMQFGTFEGDDAHVYLRLRPGQYARITRSAEAQAFAVPGGPETPRVRLDGLIAARSPKPGP